MAKTIKRIPTAIPVGTQFSPDLIDLGEFLKAIAANDGNKQAMINVIWSPPVHLKRHAVPGSRRNASLPLEAAIQYGLLTPRTYRVTALTTELAKLKDSELYEAFARHIMLNLGGLRLVEAAQQMKIDGLSINGDSLARYCTQQGFQVTEHNTAINTLRMWLSKVGVFPAKGWDVDASIKEKIVGLNGDTIATLVNFDAAQRAFVMALCRINPSGSCKASDVRDLAEQTFDVRLGRASLPKEVLEPLKQSGLIEYTSRGTAGGKSANLTTTTAFQADILRPFTEHTVNTLDPGIIDYYRMLPADIYKDLKSDDTYIKGRALEAYAIHIMRLLGLHFLWWRKRATETGNAEVDAFLTGLMGNTPTRWQVQCKNTPKGNVDLEDVAKEVGLLPLTRATHILVIANCNFTADARTFASRVMLQSPVIIHLLDNKDYAKVEASPGAIAGIIRAQAEMFARQQPKESLWARK